MTYGTYGDAILNASNNLLNYEMIRMVMDHKGKELSNEKVLEYISRIINNDRKWVLEDEAQCIKEQKR